MKNKGGYPGFIKTSRISSSIALEWAGVKPEEVGTGYGFAETKGDDWRGQRVKIQVLFRDRLSSYRIVFVRLRSFG